MVQRINSNQQIEQINTGGARSVAQQQAQSSHQSLQQSQFPRVNRMAEISQVEASDPSFSKWSKPLLFWNVWILLMAHLFLVGGYRLLYSREIPFEITVVDEEMIEKIGHTVSAFEDMIVKVLIKVSC